MLTRLDHLVILVRDLELATADYERLGRDARGITQQRKLGLVLDQAQLIEDIARFTQDVWAAAAARARVASAREQALHDRVDPAKPDQLERLIARDHVPG